MRHLQNKIIFLIGVFIVILAAILGRTYLKSNAYLDKKIVEECESKLKMVKDSSYSIVCKEELLPEKTTVIINDSKLQNSAIQANDKVIISVDFPNLLKQPLVNILTGQPIAKPTENKANFCFVIYPILIPKETKVSLPSNLAIETIIKSNSSTESDIIQREVLREIQFEEAFTQFSQNYQWQVFPSKLISNQTKGVNFVCTNQKIPFDSDERLSFIINIPSKEKLNLGYGEDVNKYGVKILMVPENISINFAKDAIKNYQQLIPIYQFTRNIM